MNPQVETYSDDAPQTDPQKDALGVAPFADRLAELLIALEAPNGYVIGLSGEWGSGKTSVLNFVKHYIEQRALQKMGKADSIVTIEFRPWLVSGHEGLVGAFFKVIAEQLHHNPPKWKNTAAGAAKLGANLSGILSKIGWLTAHADLGALAGASVALKATLDAVAKHWTAQPSLQKTYQELREIPKSSATKIVIVIDDIDRLQPDEIRAMMMMVKTVGQLPNVVYLLAYDQRIVWNALAETNPVGSNAPSYAEKIIQQEMVLPTPLPERLLEMFVEDIRFLPLPNISNQRINSLVQHGLKRWLQTPRDVLRFVNNLRFAWTSLADYLDPVDYIAIEGIRTFDKQAFSFIRSNRDFLFSSTLALFKDAEKIDTVKRFHSLIPADDLDHITAIVGLLFPSRKSAFEYTEEERSKGKLDDSYGEPYSDVRARRGLGFEDSFDTYFQLYPPSRLPSRSTIDAFTAHLDDEIWLIETLNEAQKKVRPDTLFMTVDFIRDIGDRIARPNVFSSQRQPKSTPALLRALVSVFDLKLPIRDLPHFSLNSLQSLYTTALEDLPHHQATDVLVELFSGEVTIGTAAHLTVYVLQLMGTMPGGGQNRFELIGIVNGDRLAQIVVDRIESLRTNGILAEAVPIWDVIRLWEKVRGDDPPRKWISENLNNPSLYLNLADLFVYRDGQTAWRIYHRSPNDSEDVGRFFDLSALTSAGSRLLVEANWNDDDNAKVRTLISSLKEAHYVNEGGDTLDKT